MKGNIKVQIKFLFIVMLMLVMIISSGCSAVQGIIQPATPTTEIIPTEVVVPTAEPTAIPATEAPTETPTEAIPPTATAIVHTAIPEDVIVAGNPFYDVESSGTGLKHYAPFGDIYDLNRFERPFTQTDMTYQPHLDIKQFFLYQKGDWNYAFIKTIGFIPKDETSGDYGVEVDINRDGFGDILVWSKPPYTTTWSTDRVKVFQDQNHTSGGINPALSEAPLGTDGYETLLFDSGVGIDPDLAYVRISPSDANVIEFAFKISLSTSEFMWNPWADGGLRDMGKFNYNDQISAIDAGSPLKESSQYPIKSLYSTDNSCRAYIGFTPNGSEPLLCGSNESPKAESEDKPNSCQVQQCPFLWFWNKSTCKCQMIIIILPTQVIPK